MSPDHEKAFKLELAEFALGALTAARDCVTFNGHVTAIPLAGLRTAIGKSKNGTSYEFWKSSGSKNYEIWKRFLYGRRV